MILFAPPVMYLTNRVNKHAGSRTPYKRLSTKKTCDKMGFHSSEKAFVSSSPSWNLPGFPRDCIHFPCMCGVWLRCGGWWGQDTDGFSLLPVINKPSPLSRCHECVPARVPGVCMCQAEIGTGEAV